MNIKIYENARLRAFSTVNSLLDGSLLLLTFRADAVKDYVIIGKVESMGIPDPVFKTGDKIHIHIKDTPACSAFHMAVIIADMVEAFGAPRNFKPAYLTHFR